MKQFIILLVFSLFLSMPAQAAEQGVSATHLQQAERVVLALGLVSVMAAPIEEYLAGLKISNPERHPVMKRAFEQTYSPESIKKEFSGFFASKISEEACKALADFWESEAGLAFLKSMNRPDTEKPVFAPEEWAAIAKFAQSPAFAEYSQMLPALDDFLESYTLRVKLKLFVNM